MEDAAAALRAQMRAGGLKMKQTAAALPENGAPRLRALSRAPLARVRGRAPPRAARPPPTPALVPL
jgi:hypothetical protein